MNTNYEAFHECEIIEGIPDTPRNVKNLWIVLEEHGFKVPDDVIYLPRQDKVEKWQLDSACDVRIYSGKTELRLTKRELKKSQQTWDRIAFHYLLATLPRTNIERFIEVSCRVLADLRICPFHKGIATTSETLQIQFNQYANEVENELGPPGDSGVRLLIELTYSR